MELEPMMRLATLSRGGGRIPMGMSSQTSNSSSQHLQSPMRLTEPMIPSPRSKHCDIRFALVEPVRLDLLIELGEARFVGIVRESDGGHESRCAYPTS